MKSTRFSIVSLFMAIALCAAILGWGMAQYELAQLRQQRNQIIEQTGYIEVHDASRVYIRELSRPGPLTWRFQIYLPPGHKLQSGLGIELNGHRWPTRLLDSVETQREGQFTLAVSLYEIDGNWRISRYTNDGGSDYRLVTSDFSWLQKKARREGLTLRPSSPHGQVQSYGPNQPIEILRIEQEGNANSSSLLLWLEPNLADHYRRAEPNDQATEDDLLRQQARQFYHIRK